MIELISPSRCTACNICVRVCPVNVFDVVDGGPPAIARQADCQTCFLCEAWCPDDAMYVAPDPEPGPPVDEAALAASGLLGSYRKALGWTRETRAQRAVDQTFVLLARK